MYDIAAVISRRALPRGSRCTDLLMVISDQWRLLSDPSGGAGSFRLFFLLHGGACAIQEFPLKLARLISISDLADFSPTMEIYATFLQFCPQLTISVFIATFDA